LTAGRWAQALANRADAIESGRTYLVMAR
jgi:hypothetical protein